MYCGIQLLILGTSDNLYWLGVGAGTGAGSAFCLGVGGSVVAPPPGVLNLAFHMLEHSGHICPQPWQL